ncbi:bifunctional folylpolyglutamate synthase/dihydrofolate synthase [bacterium]|nr:bifunctional folylpolyglutamate synthase/dihydrofolate synthase [bacterium]
MTSSILSDALQHGIRPGLERITALLDRLERPHARLKVVHVAGTNGKGSVCAFLSSILKHAGYRVGRYNSPHLVSYCERIWLDGAFIDDASLDRALEAVQGAAAALDPVLGPVTEFELITAAAFLWFAEQAPDLVLLEVGLGGRLDATNVVEQPELCVITRIALDHTALLGDTPEAIAREKAGILKAGVPALTGATDSAFEAIRAIAQDLSVPLRQVTEGLQGYELGLAGDHQTLNAALVLEAVQALRAAGWAVSDAALREGFKAARWPGRLESWHSAEGEQFVFDGAHNPDGIEALAHALAASPEPGGRVILMGVLADKDPGPMIRALAPHAETIILTTPPSPRGLDPTTLSALPAHPDLHLEPDWQEALALARRLALGRPILVAGSLYLVGAVCAGLGRVIEA